MSTKLDRLSELAKEDPKRRFFSIAHLITPEALNAAFRGLRKDASAGVDGVTHEEYQKDAERNIRRLHQRLKDGKYQANHCAGSTYRRRRGSRGRSRFPLWRTRSCRRQWWKYGTPSTSRTFSTALMGSDRNEGSTRRWRKWVESSVPDPRDGSWN